MDLRFFAVRDILRVCCVRDRLQVRWEMGHMQMQLKEPVYVDDFVNEIIIFA